MNARERDRQRQKRGVETETWLTRRPRLWRQVVMKTDEEEYPVQAVLLEAAETQAVEKVRVPPRNRPLRLPARRLLLIATRRLRAPPLLHPPVCHGQKGKRPVACAHGCTPGPARPAGQRACTSQSEPCGANLSLEKHTLVF